MGNMKDSGIEWIGQIPEEWNVTRVKYLAQDIDSVFIDGDWIESDIIVESGVRYLTTGNVGAGYFKEQGSGYITEETFKKLNCLKVLPGDLMISRLNEPIGRACIVPDTEEKYVVAVDNVILRPDKGYNKKYIMYCMNTDGYANAGKEAARGATMQRVSRTLLGAFYIPVAKEVEQQLIADFLDDKVGKIDDILSDLRKQVEVLQKYKKSVITKAVTKGLNPDVAMKDSGIDWIGEIPEEWDVKRLKYIMDNYDYLRKPIDATERSQEGDILYDYYGASGVIDKIDSYICEGEKILIGEDGANLVMRNLPLIYIARGQYWVNNHAHILHPKFDWNLRYFAYQMEIIDITGSAQPKLSQENLNNVILVLPPTKLQNDIANFLDGKVSKIDEIIKDKEAQIEKMEKYKKSLIYEYVTGKKRVKGAV